MLFYIWIERAKMAEILQTGDHEWTLQKGGHTMRLVQATDGQWPQWQMFTKNACTDAWRGKLGGWHGFETLAEVESHYKSWRGFSAMLATAK